MDAGLPADEGEQPPQPHHDWVPVVVVAQQGGDEEGQEHRDSAHEEEPGEPNLLGERGGAVSHVYPKRLTGDCIECEESCSRTPAGMMGCMGYHGDH